MDVTANSLPKKVIILAGGTGGHVMPALAVAEYLLQKKVSVHWIGTHSGIEARLVPNLKLPISYIDIQGLRRNGLRGWLAAPWRVFKAIYQSYRILREQRPQVVLSMGGYVSGPAAIAARLLGIPLLLHEQNSIAGWTNKILANFACKIMVAFPSAFSSHAKKRVETGNPIRESILSVDPCWQRSPHESLNILVLGGSQGASILNQIVPDALALLPPTYSLKIWHQTGKAHLDTTINYYKTRQIEATITDFIEDMAKAYAFADIIICRSGALTIAEVAAAGISSILIPYPYAVDDHQTYNARYLSEKEAAFLLLQSELSAKRLCELLLTLITQPEKRLRMAKASYQLAKRLATKNVAEQCLEVCGG